MADQADCVNDTSKAKIMIERVASASEAYLVPMPLANSDMARARSRLDNLIYSCRGLSNRTAFDATAHTHTHTNRRRKHSEGRGSS